MTTQLDRTNATAVLASCLEGNRYDGALIDKHISYIATSGPKLDATIHASAIACIYLSLPHTEGGNNCERRAVALLQTIVACNKSSRAKALLAWFTAFSNIRLRIVDGKVTGGVLKPTNKLYRDIEPMDAMDKPFWIVAEKDGEPLAYRFGDAVAALIKKANSQLIVMTEGDKAALASIEALTGMTVKPVVAKVADEVEPLNA